MEFIDFYPGYDVGLPNYLFVLLYLSKSRSYLWFLDPETKDVLKWEKI